MILLYIPVPTEVEAKKIAHHLLEKKLIACANIFPVSSMYRWQGRIADEKEVVLLLKTEKKLAKKVETEVKRLHKYTIPCILQMPVKVNKEYERWVRKEISER